MCRQAVFDEPEQIVSHRLGDDGHAAGGSVVERSGRADPFGVHEGHDHRRVPSIVQREVVVDELRAGHVVVEEPVDDRVGVDALDVHQRAAGEAGSEQMRRIDRVAHEDVVSCGHRQQLLERHRRRLQRVVERRARRALPIDLDGDELQAEPLGDRSPGVERHVRPASRNVRTDDEHPAHGDTVAGAGIVSSSTA